MLKPVQMMILKNCPHCKKALKMMKELKAKHPEYTKVDIKIIDEQEFPEIADKLDYWYVPTFFVGERKVHEGVPTIESIENVFRLALEI